jgi:branched-chain amino acid transport system ATP-binding protein
MKEQTWFSVKGLTVAYGAAPVLKGISLEVDPGSVVTLIGANGAGKSTTLRAISGLVHPAEGQISFEGKPLQGLAPQEVVRCGIAHVPEGRRVFSYMTVQENLRMGAFRRRDKKEVKGDLEKIFGHFPVLKARRNQRAGSLSGGEQQMLAIGRALMSQPKLLLLDEPSMGLAPLMVQELSRIIAEINARGVGIIIVEQNARMALRLARQAYVLETGRIVLEGPAADMLHDEHVRRAYLGG